MLGYMLEKDAKPAVLLSLNVYVIDQPTNKKEENAKLKRERRKIELMIRGRKLKSRSKL